jgi:hypothetical protein
VRDVILPFPARTQPVRAIRSTVLIGSFGELREHGHFDTYVAALPPHARDLLVSTVAGVWIPIDLALVHYAACDSLGLSADTIAALGRGVFDRIRGTLLGTTVRMAKEVGVTPWTVLPHLQRFWDRAYQGGGLRVTKLGPKEASGEVTQAAMAESFYFRNALRGLVVGVLEMFCQKAYVSITVERRSGTIDYRMQWV